MSSTLNGKDSNGLYNTFTRTKRKKEAENNWPLCNNA